MKKITALLICALVLMSGCAENTAAKQISETACTTAVTTPITAETTTTTTPETEETTTQAAETENKSSERVARAANKKKTSATEENPEETSTKKSTAAKNGKGGNRQPVEEKNTEAAEEFPEETFDTPFFAETVEVGGRSYTTDETEISIQNKDLTGEDIKNISKFRYLENLDIRVADNTDLSPLGELKYLNNFTITHGLHIWIWRIQMLRIFLPLEG